MAENETQDRPIQNVMGEFNRKFGSLEQKVDAVVDYIANQETKNAKPAESKGSKNSLSDDDLWELAKAGDKEAFDLHEKRKTVQTFKELRRAEDHNSLVSGQLGVLLNKYPALGDSNHALSRIRDTAYALLQRRGYPAGDATYLEATKTAIADRPDLIAEMYSQGTRAREGARRVSASNSGMTGATFRNDESRNGNNIRVTPEESALAKRMNVADPAKAKERFLQRRASGQSTLGAVGAFIDDENF